MWIVDCWLDYYEFDEILFLGIIQIIGETLPNFRKNFLGHEK